MLSLRVAFEWLPQSKIFMKILQDSLHTAGRPFEKSVMAALWPISKVQRPNFPTLQMWISEHEEQIKCISPGLKTKFWLHWRDVVKGGRIHSGSSGHPSIFHWFFLDYKHIALWFGSMGYAAIPVETVGSPHRMSSSHRLHSWRHRADHCGKCLPALVVANAKSMY